jgi:Holliday junction resolvasome RuvABC endonuclease subunit
MKVLALDQSVTNTGYALFQEEGEKLRLIKIDNLKPKGTGIYRFHNWVEEVDQLITNLCPDLLVRELHHQMQFGAASQLQEIAGALDLIALRKKYLDNDRYLTIGVSTWKKYFVGKGNLAKDTSYLIHLNEAFVKCKHLIPFNAVIKNDNVADAMALGLTGYTAWKMKKGKIALAEPLKKSMDSIFDYGKSV